MGIKFKSSLILDAETDEQGLSQSLGHLVIFFNTCTGLVQGNKAETITTGAMFLAKHLCKVAKSLIKIRRKPGFHWRRLISLSSFLGNSLL
mmetsp:Transcript_40825/g.65569  ORF Transcript_40825/g.65569 Transcript_40825/m.65569 type:complete len:91 (-) Transcript_40825:2852-3124(-)